MPRAAGHRAASAVRIALATLALLPGCSGTREAAREPRLASRTILSHEDDTSSRLDDEVVWATSTQSPIRSDAALFDVREQRLTERCGHPDSALSNVARHLVARRAKGLGALDADAVAATLRAAGVPHLSPRVLSASGRGPLDDDALVSRLDALGDPTRSAGGKALPAGGRSRCAVAIAPTPHGGELLVAIAVDALADLSPLPMRSRTGAWLTLSAQPLVPLRAAKVVLLGPRGEPRTVPTTLDERSGAVRARFALDRPGAFTVQVVGELQDGPRPLLEARIFADVDPPASLEADPAPGEEAAGSGSDALAVENMIAALRTSERLPPLRHDPQLAALARAHAERMRDEEHVAHDVGDGDARARFEASGETSARSIGENVAHASTVVLAHRTLHASASHRLNLLRSDWTHLGVGVAEAPDHSVYVCELFLAR